MATSGDAEDAHDSDDSRVDGDHIGLHFLEDVAGDGEDDDGHVQLIPSVVNVTPHTQRHHFGRWLHDEHGGEEVVEYFQHFYQFLQFDFFKLIICIFIDILKQITFKLISVLSRYSN